jgi:hypothetical protein
MGRLSGWDAERLGMGLTVGLSGQRERSVNRRLSVGPVCRFVEAGDPGARGTMASGEGTMASGGPGDAWSRVGVYDEKGGAR